MPCLEVVDINFCVGSCLLGCHFPSVAFLCMPPQFYNMSCQSSNFMAEMRHDAVVRVFLPLAIFPHSQRKELLDYGTFNPSDKKIHVVI